ncbi:head-tail connector protein [Clostridium sp. BJN0001]|uniref:head-tail connector protein n=1 Tax=Clostridium sp. BJN0001 TaxID=2930219 RepID=UPI001FD4995A|nr:head-tail connector protein [Clostridium sp. BJN0001]
MNNIGELLEKIKLTLRVDSDDFDEEIKDTIDAAKADLKLSGVLESKIVETDSLILRSIKIYCKAEFSSDDKETQRYTDSYNMLKNHLCLSTDYTVEVISDEN